MKIGKILTPLMTLVCGVVMGNTDTTGSPSIGNVHRSLSAIKKNMADQEIRNYIWMVVGFIIVIVVGWYSASTYVKQTKPDEHKKPTGHINDPYFKKKHE
jgi:heme/copper-type cytochrome/quinol oxidase subunit 2